MEKNKIVNKPLEQKVVVEYRGKRFSISQTALDKYKIGAPKAMASAKPNGKGRWYELGESDCF